MFKVAIVAVILIVALGAFVFLVVLCAMKLSLHPCGSWEDDGDDPDPPDGELIASDKRATSEEAALCFL